MPAKKDSSLNKRHDTKADKKKRESAEAAIKPTTKLTVKPPAALTGHKHASAIWTRLLSLYAETKGEIITAFDADELIKLCMAEEELVELQELRSEIKDVWDRHIRWLNKLKPNNENLSDYFSALQQANALLQRFQGIDARLDGKRKLIHSLAQSLYLTPRSRAGVAPPEKEPETPKSEMDKMLDGKD